MGHFISFMHVSLDGFVSGPKGEMDWIHVDEEIFDFVANHIAASDTALYGRKTFEMMEGYWPTAAEQPNATKHDIEHAKWYKSVKKFVLSRTMHESTDSRVKIICDNLNFEINQMKRSTEHDILVFGSPTATHSLIAADLIDGYWIFVNPVLLGQGVPLFKDVTHQTALQFVSSYAFASGVVCMHYETKAVAQ